MKKLLLPLLLVAASAQAHITLDQAEAAAGSSYRAVFKVGHGCDGAATTAIAITLPPGLRVAKPMPKPGWTLTTTRRPLKTPYESHGKLITDELAELRWVAKSEAEFLPDAWYDEFLLRATLPAEPGELGFAVRQVCTRGESNWVARLRVMPAALPAHAH